MTNFEHYKEKIKKAINDECLLAFLKEHGCVYNTELYEVTIWYLDEYVEPYKLTEFEKDVLENLNKGEKYIFKNGQTELIWTLNESEGSHFILSRLFPKIEFKCLEYDKKYKIDDILANCEVID